MKAVKTLTHFLHLFISHCLITGNTELTTMNILGNRKLHVVPRSETDLFVRWNGIMDHCSYALLTQVFL